METAWDGLVLKIQTNKCGLFIIRILQKGFKQLSSISTGVKDAI